jgi:CubicO group peptidase (beta-lactamase class C family)
MHKGKIIYEKYFGEGAAHRPHIAYSVTKSFVGTLAATLAAQGKLDPQAGVTKYVPELKGSAYDDGDGTIELPRAATYLSMSSAPGSGLPIVTITSASFQRSIPSIAPKWAASVPSWRKSASISL